MGNKKTIEKITETDSSGMEKTKTVEKEIIEIDDEKPKNPYEFMTNKELLTEWAKIGEILKNL
jgi:flagellar biosynthesis/type III secretory pathway chaperone